MDTLKKYHVELLEDSYDKIVAFSWDDIWFTENDIKKSDNLIIDPLFFTKEKKKTLVVSHTLQNAYLIWKYYEDKNSVNNQVKAYLETPTGTVLYDVIVHFNGWEIIAEPNLDMENALLSLYKECDLWVKSVFEIGYEATNDKGIKPIPDGFEWIVIE